MRSEREDMRAFIRRAGCFLALGALGFTGCDPVVDQSTRVELQLLEVIPAQLPARGGVKVTVIGENLTAPLQVLLDDEPLDDVLLLDDRRLSIIAPPLTAGKRTL